MREEIVFRTPDAPTANGRKPQAGDVEYSLRFPTEDGKELVVYMGQLGYEKVSQFILDMLAETPSYGDGSTNIG